MKKQDIVKEYKKGPFTIVWKPELCIHSEKCVQSLPQVYRPGEKPWINPECASVEDLQEQIAKCPSGALSYYEEGDAQPKDEYRETRVEVMADGPLLVHGNLTVIGPQGKKEGRSKTTAFCRCGASGNKPYCDGSHVKAGFRD